MKPNNTIAFDLTQGFSSLPAYDKVAEFLQNEIRNGILTHGANLPPEPTLAKKLGVSRVTLRHALKNLEKKGLLIRRRGRNGGNFICVPGKETNISRKTIGIVCNLKNPNREPYFLDILEGIQGQLGENANLLLASTIGDNILDFYHANHLDGIFIINPPLKNTILFDNLVMEAIPHAIISASPEHIKNDTLVLVDTDNSYGAMSGMQHLISLGHKRIAYIGGYPGYSNSRDRLESYKKGLSVNSIELDPELIHAKPQEEPYENFTNSAIKTLLSLENPPTAIFAAGFTMAMETILSIRKTGMTVPDDISVMGFDDFEPFTNINHPFLTTVRQPLVELGQTAARKIIEWINTGNVKQKHLVLPTELIIRKSCYKTQQKR